MKRTIKKTISVFLVVAMLLCAAPLNGFVGLEFMSLFDFKAKAASYSGTCGNDLIWSLDADTGELIISGTGDMSIYGYSFWSDFRSEIKTVIIEEGVTSIASYAFEDYKNLISVEISDTVTTVNNGAFWGCSNLSSITVPDSVRAIGTNAFTNPTQVLCNKDSAAHMYAIENGMAYWLLDDETQEQTFSGKIGTKLTWSIDKMSRTLTIDNIGAMVSFASDDAPWKAYKEYVRSVVVNDGCTNISQNAFYECEYIVSVDLPNSLETIDDSAFYHCSSLKEITIPKNVYSIGFAAFYECTSLSRVDFSGNNKITSISQNAFAYCSSITEMDIPESVTSIESYAFEYCTNLSEFSIPKNVSYIGYYAFSHISFGKSDIKLENVNIESNAFEYCKNINSVDLTNCSVGYQAFLNSEVINVNIDNCTFESRASYYSETNTFDNCSNLKNISFHNTSIPDSAFSGCSNVETLTFSGDKTSLRVASSSFENCDQLTSVVFECTYLDIGSSAFYDCDVLESVSINCSTSNGNNYIYSNAFYGCDNLKAAIISVGVDSLGSQAFANCPNLTKVTIYNKDCEIAETAISIYSTIYGYTGSTAEAFANTYGYEFVSIDAPCEHSYSNDCDPLCNVCGETRETAHKYGEWSVIKEPTCKNTGVKEKTCSICRNVEKETVPTVAHNYGEWTVTKAATCTSTGAKERICSVSGCVEIATINILPHTDENDDGICEVCKRQFEIKYPMNGICGPDLTWTLDDNGVLTIEGTGTMYDFSSGEYINVYVGEEYSTEYETTTKRDYDYTTTKAPWYGETTTAEPWYDYTTVTRNERPTTTQKPTTYYETTYIPTTAYPTTTNFYDYYSVVEDGRILIEEETCAITGEESTTALERGKMNIVPQAEAEDNVTTTNNYIRVYRWNKHIDKIKKVVISDSVTNIGDYAFSDCTNLAEVDMADSIKSIGYKAFNNCSALTEIEIPQKVTTIENYAFYDCISLNTLNFYAQNCNWSGYTFTNTAVKTLNVGATVNSIPKFYTLESVTFEEGATYVPNSAFSSCDRLISVNLPDSITTIGEYAFAYCYSLTEITIPKGVKTISYDAFYNCYSLNTVNFNAQNINSIYYDAFYNTSVKILNIGASVSKIPLVFSYLETVTFADGATLVPDGAFRGCMQLKTVNLPDSITRIGNDAFYNCHSLFISELPENTTHIGDNAFYNCDSIEEFTIEGKIETISSYAFNSCSSLKTLNFNAKNCNNIYYDAFYNCPIKTLNVGADVCYLPVSLSSVETVNFAEGATAVPANAFNYYTKLKTVNLPDSITTIGEYAFAYCYSLESFKVGENVSKIEPNAFYGCSALRIVILGENVTEIGNSAFKNSGINVITINKKLKTIGESAFDSCNSLANVFYKGAKAEWDNVVVLQKNTALKNARIFFEDDVTGELNKGLNWSFEPETGTLRISGEGEIGWKDGELPPWNNHRPDVLKVIIGDGITSLGSAMFSDFMCLEEVTLPEGITAIGDWTFDSCTFLSNINLPDSIKSIGDFAFWGCTSLQEIRIPGSVETIGMYAFSNCNNLKELSLENGILKIESSAFEKCSSLESVTIPESVVRIGYDAFYYCTNLKELVFNAINCSFAGASDDVYSAFYGCNKLTDVTIGEKVEHVPACFLSRCKYIEKIIIPDSVKTIGHHAFWHCDRLLDITIGDNIEEIGGWAFDYTAYKSNEENRRDNLICLDYCLIGISGYDIKVDDSITVIQDHVFRSNWILYSVELPSWMTEINEFMFDGCRNLTYVKLPENLKKIGAYAFFNCSNLSGLSLPETVETIGDYAFYKCTAITHMRIPNSVKHIADTAFFGCNTIDLHCEEGSYGCYYAECNRMNLSVFMKEIGGYCIIKNGVLTKFYGEGFDGYEYYCNLVIPSNVTAIGYYAFENDNRLVNIELPYNVTTIYPRAFADCPNLKKVIIPFTVTDIADSAFEGTDATIYCYYNSYAYNYAVENGIDYELITVTLSSNSVNMLAGESIVINAVPSVNVASGIPLVWKSADSSVASVDSTGKIVGGNVGETTIGIYSFDGALLDECSVTVSEPVDEFENVELNFEPVSTDTLKYGEKIVLHINVADLPEGASVEWMSSNGAILRISNVNAECGTHEGCVTATVESIGNGSAEIIVTVVNENGEPVIRDDEEIKVSYTMNSKAGFFWKIIAFFKQLFGLSKIILQSVE